MRSPLQPSSSLRAEARRQLWIGLAVWFLALLAGTVLVARYEHGSVAPEHLLDAHTGSQILLLLDVMALAFLFWGPYISLRMAQRADAVVRHETQALREQASQLEHELGSAPEAGPFLGLPNRRALLSALAQVIARRRDGGECSALLVLHTDQYHEAASAQGKEAAQEFALQLAERLRKALSAGDFLAHLGHDDFAVLRPRLTDEAQARRLASRLQLALDLPLRVSNAPLSVRAAIGIALCPQHGRDAEDLLRRAETAKFAAAAERRDYQLYEASLDDARAETPRLIAELHAALHHDGLHETYEPQQPLRPGLPPRLRLACAWDHPRVGAIDEPDFLNLSDRLSLVQSLALWQLREGLARLAEWRSTGLDVAMVIRPPQSALRQLPLADMALRMLTSHDLPPGCLTLEFTEAALVESGANGRQQLTTLRSTGVHIGLEGLGQPGASVATPLYFPLDEVRIGPALVGRSAHDALARNLLNGLLGLMAPLRLRITVCGVDTDALREAAQGHPVSWLEGIAIHRRCTAPEVSAWLAGSDAEPPAAGVAI